jgi:hypothetical protein
LDFSGTDVTYNQTGTALWTMTRISINSDTDGTFSLAPFTLDTHLITVNGTSLILAAGTRANPTASQTWKVVRLGTGELDKYSIQQGTQAMTVSLSGDLILAPIDNGNPYQHWYFEQQS